MVMPSSPRLWLGVTCPQVSVRHVLTGMVLVVVVSTAVSRHIMMLVGVMIHDVSLVRRNKNITYTALMREERFGTILRYWF